MKKIFGLCGFGFLLAFVLIFNISKVQAQTPAPTLIVTGPTVISRVFKDSSNNRINTISFDVNTNNQGVCMRSVTEHETYYQNHYKDITVFPGCVYEMVTSSTYSGQTLMPTLRETVRVFATSSSRRFGTGDEIVPRSGLTSVTSYLYPGGPVASSTIKNGYILSGASLVDSGIIWIEITNNQSVYVPDAIGQAGHSKLVSLGWVKESDLTFKPVSVTSCTPSQSETSLGTAVRWNAEVTGGRAPYTFYWSDVSGVIDTNHSSSAVRTYTTSGVKSMALAVIDSENNKRDWATCPNTVDVGLPRIVNKPVYPYNTYFYLHDSLENNANYNFDLFFLGKRTSVDYNIFVELVDENGITKYSTTTSPTPKTTQWSGATVSVPVSITIPSNLAPGQYKVKAGLYNPVTGTKIRLAFGTDFAADSQNRYEIASINIVPVIPAFYCGISAPEVTTGTPVTWTVFVTKGRAPYRFDFDGAGEFTVNNNTTGSISHAYSQAGVKFMKVTVTDANGGKKEMPYCTVNDYNRTIYVNVIASSTTIVNGCYQFQNNLDIGSTGIDVTSLQKLLITKGYLSASQVDSPSGYFGAKTKSAVQAYQTANGIAVTGSVGPITRAKLNSSCNSDSTIAVVSPNGGESYTIGESVPIRWSSRNIQSNLLQIGLIGPAGTNLAQVEPHAAGDSNLFNWTISSGHTPGQYKVTVTDPNNYSVTDASDNYFTIRPATVTSPTITTWTGPTSVTTGSNLSYSINFNTVKTTADQTIFVHFVDSTGTNRFVSSVSPSTRTTQWTGTVSTPITVAVPAGIPTGTYKVMAGLYTTASGRLPLTAGSAVTVDSQTRYQVGTITVNAPTTALSLSCTPSVTSATTGTTVTWNAVARGGVTPYRYYFSDVSGQITDNTTGSITRTYTTAGSKYMSIAVIDAANAKVDWAFCTGNVNVTSPTVTPPPVTPPTTPPVTYCEISAPSCPKYPTYQGTTRDSYLGSDKDQTKCLARASAFVPWCGAKLPVTARYYSDGAKVGEQVAQPVSTTTGYLNKTSLMSSVWGVFMGLIGN